MTLAPTNDGLTNNSTWKIGDLQISQLLSIVSNPDTGQADRVQVKYSVVNTGATTHTVELRQMIDTELNYNDGAPFRVPGVGIVTREMEFDEPAIPPTLYSFFNVSDSAHVAAITTQDAASVTPSRLLLASWPRIWTTAFDYTVDPFVDFTSDSAYALYWPSQSLGAAATSTYINYIGLAQLNVDLNPPLALGVNAPAALDNVNGAYSPNPFNVTATVFNNGAATATGVQLSIALPAGLTLAAGDAAQSVGDLNVGQERQVTWSVQASPQAGNVTLAYSVSASATNAQPKTLVNQIALPALSAPCSSEQVVFISGITFNLPTVQDRNTTRPAKAFSVQDFGSGGRAFFDKPGGIMDYLRNSGYTDADFKFFSYNPAWSTADGDNPNNGRYNGADTRDHSVGESASLLGRELTYWMGKCPQSHFIIVAHSLGGAVAAYWASLATPSQIAQTRAIVTLESPLAGVSPGNCALNSLLRDIPAKVVGGNVAISLCDASVSGVQKKMKDGIARITTLSLNDGNDPVVNGCLANGTSRGDGLFNAISANNGRVWDSVDFTPTGIRITVPSGVANLLTCYGAQGLVGLAELAVGLAGDHLLPFDPACECTAAVHDFLHRARYSGFYDDPKLQYAGSWSHPSNGHRILGTESISSNVGDIATLAIPANRTSVTLIYPMSPGGGSFKVEMCGTSQNLRQWPTIDARTELRLSITCSNPVLKVTVLPFIPFTRIGRPVSIDAVEIR